MFLGANFGHIRRTDGSRATGHTAGLRETQNSFSGGLSGLSVRVVNIAGVRTREIPELDIPDLPGAACKGVVTGPEDDIFHPGRGAGGRNMRDQAKAMCNGCPIKQRCLEYALDWDANHDFYQRTEGVWGGTTREERDEILRGTSVA